MLLFRSEDHVRRWCRAWKLERGAVFSLEKGWRLAKVWYADRLDPAWQPFTPAEAAVLLRRLGFTSPFWRLPA